MQKISCNFCKSETPQKIYTVEDRLYKTTRQKFDLVECANCGLVFLSPQPSSEELPSFYPEGYRPYKKRREEENIYKPSAKPTKKVLDVGCGSGDFLIELYRDHKDWELHGTDIDPRSVATAKSAGFPIEQGTLEEVPYPAESFDTLYMSHVLEHVPNPLETLRSSANLLKKTGTLSITIPNFGSLSRKIFGSYWYHIDAPRHLYQFSPRVLRQMLLASGFHNIKITYIPSPKYFLQSYALWKYGTKKRFPKFVWYLLEIPARIISALRLSSTMTVVAEKK